VSNLGADTMQEAGIYLGMPFLGFMN